MADYINIYTDSSKNKLELLNDALLLWNYVLGKNNNHPPINNSLLNNDLLEKNSDVKTIYNDYYEFILTTGEKKIILIDNILKEDDINKITNNNKNLLLHVYISKKCLKIDNNCFKNCNNLTFISYLNFDNNDKILLESIEENAFENCKSMEECKLLDKENNIRIIKKNAFINCGKLYEITLEKSKIKTIESYAFYNCKNLVNIVFPDTLDNIQEYAFNKTNLTNIYFDNKIPSNLSSNIFDYSLPKNCCCYYNSKYVKFLDYNKLKKLFKFSSNVIFIDTLYKNSIDNKIENNKKFYNIKSSNISNDIIKYATNVIDSIIKKYNENYIYEIIIDYDYELIGENTLGYADWDRKEIFINPDNNNGITVYLNNEKIPFNSVVIIHELLHIFGFGSGTLWNNITDYDTALDLFYKGINGIYQYNKILMSNGYKKKLNYLTIEDSGGNGTMSSHTEEGFYINEDFFNPQMRADKKGNVYPSIRNDIMSGYLNQKNYFTKQCCGILQDLGYSINYNSKYIYNGNIEFFPNIKKNNIPDTYININDDTSLKRYKNTNLRNISESNSSDLKVKYNCNKNCGCKKFF